MFKRTGAVVALSFLSIATAQAAITLTATAGNAQVALAWSFSGATPGNQEVYIDTDSNPIGRSMRTLWLLLAGCAVPAYVVPAAFTDPGAARTSAGTMTRVEPPMKLPIEPHSAATHGTPTTTFDAVNAAGAEAQRRIDVKYGALLDASRLDSDLLPRVRAWLIERETIANDYELNDREAVPSQLDARLEAALHPADFARYELIKDADAPLQSLEEFRLGMAHVQPMSDEQMAAMADAKLRQWSLTRVTPEAAHRALTDFLYEAAAVLTPDQLQHLIDFERTEFERRQHTR